MKKAREIENVDCSLFADPNDGLATAVQLRNLLVGLFDLIERHHAFDDRHDLKKDSDMIRWGKFPFKLAVERF